MKQKIKDTDLYFQNLKGLLIFLVVVGHFIEIMSNAEGLLLETVYFFIYVFHMPLFVLISGYFSKKTNLKRVLSLLIIYTIFQMFLYPIGLSLLSNKSIDIDLSISRFIKPRYTYWYLISLITWRIVTPKLPKNKITLVLLLILSIIPSITPNIEWVKLSSGRTLAFYPFFYYGYLINKEQFNKVFLNTPKKVSYIGIMLITLLLNTLFIKNNIPREFLYKKDCLLRYVPDTVDILVISVFIFVLTMLSMKFICSLVGSNKCILTKWGNNTMLIYLVHGFLFKSMSFNAKSMSQISYLILSIVVSYGLCELLSIRWHRKINYSTHKNFHLSA